MVVDPGDRVRLLNKPAYKVIFNPRPKHYSTSIAPDELAGAYRPDAPTTTVMSRPRTRETRKGRFRVPAAPPGVYLC